MSREDLFEKVKALAHLNDYSVDPKGSRLILQQMKGKDRYEVIVNGDRIISVNFTGTFTDRDKEFYKGLMNL